MPFALTIDGETTILVPGQSFTVGDVQYPGNITALWSDADLADIGIVELPPEPLTAEQICTLVDAERDRRIALDFIYDFGATPALNHLGDEIAAGVRSLQMSPADRANWQVAQGAALTAFLLDQPNVVQPLRAEDNWNIQTTASQVLAVLAAMTQHGAALLFHGGAVKEQIRAATDPASIDISEGWP